MTTIAWDGKTRYGASPATLAARMAYGGRKGRSAERRLARATVARLGGAAPELRRRLRGFTFYGTGARPASMHSPLPADFLRIKDVYLHGHHGPVRLAPHFSTLRTPVTMFFDIINRHIIIVPAPALGETVTVTYETK